MFSNPRLIFTSKVGRTGCGKSTFFQALFRINDPVEGTVKISGKDFCSIGLKQLRSSIGIIPQDPVLFAGTIRSNLDPFDEFKGDSGDSKLWEALKHAHLYDVVKESGDELQMEILQSGENLSVGQRQLVCLARALLRDTKIIVLDEATANVDAETDALIQKTVRENFANKTTLTIAHRLETIMDSDKIIVVDKGHVAEFDRPINLLNKKTSIFKSLVDDTGPANAEYLYKIASGDEIINLDEELIKVRRASSLDAEQLENELKGISNIDANNKIAAPSIFKTEKSLDDREMKMIIFAKNQNNIGKSISINRIKYELIKPADPLPGLVNKSLTGSGRGLETCNSLSLRNVSNSFTNVDDLFQLNNSIRVSSQNGSSRGGGMIPVAMFKDPNGFNVLIELH